MQNSDPPSPTPPSRAFRGAVMQRFEDEEEFAAQQRAFEEALFAEIDQLNFEYELEDRLAELEAIVASMPPEAPTSGGAAELFLAVREHGRDDITVRDVVDVEPMVDIMDEPTVVLAFYVRERASVPEQELERMAAADAEARRLAEAIKQVRAARLREQQLMDAADREPKVHRDAEQLRKAEELKAEQAMALERANAERKLQQRQANAKARRLRQEQERLRKQANREAVQEEAAQREAERQLKLVEEQKKQALWKAEAERRSANAPALLTNVLPPLSPKQTDLRSLQTDFSAAGALRGRPSGWQYRQYVSAWDSGRSGFSTEYILGEVYQWVIHVHRARDGSFVSASVQRREAVGRDTAEKLDVTKRQLINLGLPEKHAPDSSNDGYLEWKPGNGRAPGKWETWKDRWGKKNSAWRRV